MDSRETCDLRDLMVSLSNHEVGRVEAELIPT